MAHQTLLGKTYTKKIRFSGINGCTLNAHVIIGGFASNGHFDFSITGEVINPHPKHNEDPWLTCGCIHEIIVKHFQFLDRFIPMHQSATNGEPMYPTANGLYHLANSSKDLVKRYLRISDEEYDELHSSFAGVFFKDKVCDFLTYDKRSETEHDFKQKLLSFGIPQRWKQEANEFIEFLEEETGKKFVDPLETHKGLVFPL